MGREEVGPPSATWAGGGRFTGTIADVRVSAGARPAEWIRTTHESMRDPAGFCRQLV